VLTQCGVWFSATQTPYVACQSGSSIGKQLISSSGKIGAASLYEGMDRPVLLTLTCVKGDPERGTSGPHDIAIRPEPMRTTEITAPGQPTCGPYQPRSPTTQHKTRPTGRLIIRLGPSWSAYGAGCAGSLSAGASSDGAGCAGSLSAGVPWSEFGTIAVTLVALRRRKRM
jgi:hypothetical protein